MLGTEDKIRNGPHVGRVATLPLPSRGSPMLCTGTKSEMAHRGSQWLATPTVSGVPNALDRDIVRIGRHVGTVVVSGVPISLHGGQNPKRTICGHSGYLTPAVSGVPNALDRGQNHKWPTCGHSGYLNRAVSGVPNAVHGDKIRNGPHVGTVASKPLPSRGSPML